MRYPGGKAKLSDFLSRVCLRNGINGHYIEPYAGGAAVALFLLMEGYVKEITINDKDRSIYAFWHSVLYETDELCTLISRTRVVVSNWHKQREVQSRKETATLLELGFSTFFMNRTNHSGVIAGGIIGGLGQAGEYKLDCRFNKKRLISLIRKISLQRKFIHLTNDDALDLIEKFKAKENLSENTIFYFDPPYYLKGESLYMNHYKHEDHAAVAEAIGSIKNAHWLVSYDLTLPITRLYKNFASKRYGLQHTAHTSKLGKEVMFVSPYLSVPKSVFA